ncbi:C40 family peptidase [Corynebacterium sp. HMSC074C04]|uniref:C40 family peptidase n=1 Tax=Corynebacterium sp. HMSC074C04 TaxID=1739514 RepID=UPI001FEE108B|nr:C40 family peptidase [Corynebacterium sp. HMSC074C04]
MADSVDRNWGDGARSGAGAAGTSLKQAANAAADLEARAGTIDSDIAKGLAAVMSAATDLARIAMDFVTSAMGSLTATAAGPAGLAATGASLVSAASSSISQAIARLMKLEQELRPLVQSLIQQASTAVDTPAPPRPTQLEAPSRLRFYVYEHPRIGQRYRRCRWFVGVVRFGRRAGACGCGAGAPTPEAQAAVKAALSAVGTPYGWGGNTPGQALDCSGLTHWAYGQAGVDIPRTAEAQAVGRQVSQDELLPGDLAVWDGHVAMVIGDGKMVEAGDPVQVNPVRTTNIGMPFKGFYRPTG